MRRAVPAAVLLLVIAGCDSGEQAAPAPSDPAVALTPAALPPQADDFPALASKDCAAVVEFYLEALGGREWAKAALVWVDPVIDGARLTPRAPACRRRGW
jgi:hypothetical protein